MGEQNISQSQCEPLVDAAFLEAHGIMPRSTTYKMASLGLLASYRLGSRRRALRFKVSEVLECLRKPVRAEGKVRTL